MKKATLAVFWTLVAIFVLLLSYFLIPFSITFRRKLFPAAAVLGFLFLVLGIVLIVLSRKEKKKLRKFLVLTGISAIAPFVFSILHNMFYAFAVLSENITVLHWVMEALHAAFFIIALLVSPTAFLIGIIGSILLMRSKK